MAALRSFDSGKLFQFVCRRLFEWKEPEGERLKKENAVNLPHVTLFDYLNNITETLRVVCLEGIHGDLYIIPKINKSLPFILP